MNILTFDIGGSAVKMCLFKDDEIYEKKTIFFEVDNYSDFYDLICQEIDKYKEEIEGIALSTPGVPCNKSGIISGLSAVPCIHEDNWIKRLRERYNIAISVENDANCALLAEIWKGNAKNCKNVVSIVIGTGIGGAVLCDSKIQRGAVLSGGEFGYLLVKKDNRLMNLSDHIATKALIERVNTIHDVKNGIEIFELYDLGHKEIIEVVDEYFFDLSQFIYNITYCYEPEKILLGGGISSRKGICEEINKNFKKIGSIVNQEYIDLSIDTCYYKNDSNLIGALYNWYSENVPGFVA